MHLSNPWVRLAVFLVTLSVLSVAWWLISPLFLSKPVHEGFPTLAYMPSKTPRAQTETVPEATATMRAPATEAATTLDENMPDKAGVTLLAVGDFYPVTHRGEGSASLYQFGDGSRVLRLEDFYVLNGPDLHVYLSALDPVPSTIGQEPVDYLDLGDLKGNTGNQNYEIPADADLSTFKSVVIWCVPFRAPFSAAPLQLP